MMGINILVSLRGAYSVTKQSFKNKIASLSLAMTILCVFVPSVFANNLQITNLNVASVDTAANKMTFTYDLAQDNSWKTTINNDAVWVFMKYSTDGGVTWSHASMAGYGNNPTGFSAPNNFDVIVPTDGRGLFVQRNDYSQGNIAAHGIKFVWNYGQDGVSSAVAQAANTIHKVFGVEMVYIPQGAFYAGDGSSSSNYRFKQGSGDNAPWYIQNENAITTANTASGGFYYQSTGANNENNNGDSFLIPASYPKGFSAFYLMKYELTEGEWVGFFNTLSNTAKSHRDITVAALGGKNSDTVVNRNTIAWDHNSPASKATTLRPSRPVSYVSWPDIAAFAAWAGLRPITELEFEKTARGKDISPVADELVWGSTSYMVLGSGEITPANSDEDGTETISNTAANLNRNAIGFSSGDGRISGIAENQAGSVRVGLFAATALNRINAGSGFYGNMELSGNLAEPVVTIGRSQGRQFLGTHGNGQLTTLSGYEGYAPNTDWPGIDTGNASRGITGTVGIGYRGGDFASSNIRVFQLSSRDYAAKDPDSQGYLQRYDSSFGVFQGGRLGRSAP